MLYEIMFSPTGGSSKVTRRLADAWDCDKKEIDIFRRDYMNKLPELSSEELCLISAPVFSGRIPSIAAERLALLKGNGAKAVIIAVFGNRAVDDALVEMEDILTEAGFNICAGIEAVAEHSLGREFGAGRPDREDAQCLTDFGRKIIGKLSTGDFSKPQLPGSRPYKSPGSGPVPMVEAGCISCGICARECPAEAISFGGNWVADKDKCISCMHCIRFCPKSYRKIAADVQQTLNKKLGAACGGRKENKLYI